MSAVANVAEKFKQNICSTTGHLPFLVWGGERAMTGKLRPQNCSLVCKTLAFVYFYGFSLCIPSVAIMVAPHPDYGTRALQCMTSFLAGNSQKFDNSFLHLLGLDHEDQFSAKEDAVVHLDTFWISTV